MLTLLFSLALLLLLLTLLLSLALLLLLLTLLLSLTLLLFGLSLLFSFSFFFLLVDDVEIVEELAFFFNHVILFVLRLIVEIVKELTALLQLVVVILIILILIVNVIEELSTLFDLVVVLVLSLSVVDVVEELALLEHLVVDVVVLSSFILEVHVAVEPFLLLFFFLFLLLFLGLLHLSLHRLIKQVLIVFRQFVLSVCLVVEVEIVGETESSSRDELEVVVGYDEVFESLHLVCHLLVGLHLLLIDISFVVVEERSDLQHVNPVSDFDVDIEVSDREVHEVVSGHLI